MAQKTLSVKLSLNDKQFQSRLKKATRSMKKFGQSMKRTGQTMTRSLTLPILALGAASIAAFDKQAKAIAQVEAGIKSTGGAAGFTSEQLQKMAADLQKKTLFGDEEILKGATSQLLTFTNIAGEQFARTQVAALNLATKLDGDLKSASIQLGKALNNPVTNLAALKRSGIEFSDAQEKTIKSLAETNRLAEAQTIILDELEKQYGGSAEAAAKAGAGGFKQLQNALMDVSEEFGAIIVDGIDPLKDSLEAFTKVLSNTSKETKQSMVFFGTIAAVLGPVLIIFGLLITAFATVKSFILVSLVPAFKMLIKILANLTPQGRIISGLILAASFIISHFEPLKKTFNDIKDSILGVKDAKEELDKSLDTTIQTSTQSPEDARANMMRAIQAGVIGFKPKPIKTPSIQRSSIPDSIEPIKAMAVALKEVNTEFKTLKPIVEDFEDSLSGMDIVANDITQSFLSFGNVFQSVFAQALQSQEGFFKSFVEGTKRALAALAAQISSMLILNALLGGTGLGNLLGFTGIGGFGGIGQVISGVGSVDANSVGVGGSLRSMMNTGGGVEVFGTLGGADIILSSDRARNNRNRTRGY
jgi:hypothetical protein